MLQSLLLSTHTEFEQGVLDLLDGDLVFKFIALELVIGEQFESGLNRIPHRIQFSLNDESC